MKHKHILLLADNESSILLTPEALEEYIMKTEISIAKNSQEVFDFYLTDEKLQMQKNPILFFWLAKSQYAMAIRFFGKSRPIQISKKS
jgi:hypothetical protein